MGELKIFVERVVDGTPTHVGAYPAFIGKDYRLFHIFGAGEMARYVNESWKLAVLESQPGIPDVTSNEMQDLAVRFSNGETEWRWLPLERLLAYDWDRRITVEGVVGPIGLTELEKTGDTQRVVGSDDVQAANYRKHAGFREVTRDEMHALIASNPALLEDKAEGIGKVFTTVHVDRSVAQLFRFERPLAWLQKVAAPDSCVLLAMEI